MHPAPALLLAAVLATPPALAQPRCDPATLKVALDIGHDQTHPGATSARGNTEFGYNRGLAESTLQALQSNGFKAAFLIGQSGAPMPLPRRSHIAQEARAALFISLHHDSAQPHYFTTWQQDGRTLPYSDRFHGYAIFVSTTSPWAAQSRALANDLAQALRSQGLTPTLHHAEPIPGENRRLLDPAAGIYDFGELAVLRNATMPALLLETGVIVNRAEEQQIQSGAYHPKVATALLAAIRKYCDRQR